MRFTFEQLPEEVAKIHDKLDRISKLLSPKEISTEVPENNLLNIQQAAQYLSLAVNTIYSKVSRKEIPYIKKGKRLYFFKDQLADWVESGTSSNTSLIEAETETQFLAKHLRKARRLF
ncbi:helix-turn-helix domain-containing protein [Pedobacter endophyticus]|uniref:Helix-turn-helix domain-containing protein n=1 Tax=Pedobacter endophyticus TaxID=2789740 RepID=A0A7U3Q4Y5_9SPHI|nr:helix-turn-helix domain-containing protein [Pedobacter endophyticus]QPH38685.1 helix-turn-helix domain-containing protein [Pedobacter endophyticus]